MSDVSTLPTTERVVAPQAASLWQTIVVLFKLRIVTLLLLAAMGGAFLAAGGIPAAGDLLLLLITGGAAAAGASALNQFLERERDAAMRRTNKRPLAAGVLRRPTLILAIGLGLITAAVLVSLPVNPWLAIHLGLGALIYVGVYTIWLKPRSITNIVIGGAAGSCAVLAGGAAAGNWMDPGVLALAGLIFTWTPMHFWSLALLYRDDYVVTGVPMLPVYTSAIVAARWVLAHGVVTALIAMYMAVHPTLGWIYFIPTVAATVWMMHSGITFLRRPERREALDFFKASNLYLAIVLLLVCGAAMI
ncbi:MAG: protoheme IX farnesyltransferase [Oscillochloris sp.]|nr:protoheme IX farnesyltransferase [Oscillochloris sp.]